MKVIVDSREPKWISKALKRYGLDVRIEALDFGDVMNDKVIIERKTMSDLWSSISDGRLTKQSKFMVKLAESEGKIPYFIIHGYLEREPHLDFNRVMNAVYGAIASLSYRSGAQVIYTEDGDMAVYIMVKVLKGVNEGKIAMPWIIRHNDKRVQALVNLFGIAPSLARALLFHFNSVKRVLGASKEELMMVNGIGERKAKRIWNIINKEWR